MGLETIIPQSVMDIDFGSIFKGGSMFFMLILSLIVLAIIVGCVFYFYSQKKLYNKRLHFFEEVNGRFIPVEDLLAAELVVPGTDIKVFHVKSNDLYLPRATKRMGKNKYWYAIRNNREIINFTMKNINDDMKEANLDFDHTDMRYAHTNLREIIKRSYRDKSTKWWKEYKDLISTIIFIFVMSISFSILIYQMTKLVGSIGGLVSRVSELIETAVQVQQSCSGQVSGVAPK